MEQMKAVLCRRPGEPSELVIGDIQPPAAGPGQVIVEVKSCAVNYPDLLMVQGLYQYKAPHPFSPGGDIAGIVESVGPGAERFAPGDEVFGQIPYGGFAEKIAADEDALYLKPEGVDFNTAASVMMVYCSSWHALKDRAGLKEGETLAVLGAAGGIGLTSVEMGKILGARVIACASNDEKLELCRSRGADELVNYSKTDLKTALKQLTGGRGADVVMDPAGGSLAEAALRATAWDGRYLVTGFTAGIPSLPMNLVLLKGCQVIGVFWRRFTELEPEAADVNTSEIIEMLSEGRIQPHIGKTYSLEQAPQALDDLLNRRALGKLVINP